MENANYGLPQANSLYEILWAKQHAGFRTQLFIANQMNPRAIKNCEICRVAEEGNVNGEKKSIEAAKTVSELD